MPNAVFYTAHLFNSIKNKRFRVLIENSRINVVEQIFSSMKFLDFLLIKITSSHSENLSIFIGNCMVYNVFDIRVYSHCA